jgi:hypothetical protein
MSLFSCPDKRKEKEKPFPQAIIFQRIRETDQLPLIWEIGLIYRHDSCEIKRILITTSILLYIQYRLSLTK